MNIFELMVVFTTPIGALVGGFLGIQNSFLWAVCGAIIGAVLGFFTGPILGVVFLMFEHLSAQSQLKQKQDAK